MDHRPYSFCARAVVRVGTNIFMYLETVGSEGRAAGVFGFVATDANL